MRVLLKGCCLLGLAVLVSSCAKTADYATETGKKLFPFQGVSMSALKLKSVEPKTLKLKGFDDIRIYRYSIKVTSEYSAKGYLFEGPKAGGDLVRNRILFGHWLGGIQYIDKAEWEFFAEAAEFAREGNVCVLPIGKHPWDEVPRGTAEDIGLTAAQVNDYRIALDILYSRAGKLPQKAMLISHDYGAMFGILAAAADSRIGAAVIMTPVPRFYQWNRIVKRIQDGPVMDAYQIAMKPYDPVSLVGELAIPMLFQYADSDQYVNKTDALSLLDAAVSAKKDIRWYPTSHNLTRYPRATAERKAWVDAVLAEWK